MISQIALIVTALGVLGVIYSLRQNHRERLRQFEAMYVQRYWSIIDRLSLEVLTGQDNYTLTDDDEKAIRAYFFLCEDELELRAEKCIADHTYRIWADGICSQLLQSAFSRVWDRVRKEKAFPYRYMNLLFENGSDYDPCKMWLPIRWLRGIAGPGGV
ncbi:MAG TPA: hypothetical protein VMU94_26725 [Streptosporangiaceae bacterium]|nr:hypothetical protein [Streptosporangiaceae bacterium]